MPEKFRDLILESSSVAEPGQFVSYIKIHDIGYFKELVVEADPVK